MTETTVLRDARLSRIIPALRELAEDTETALEAAIALLLDGDPVNEQKLLGHVLDAYRSNNAALNVLNLLDESGSEPALREVERNQAKRRNGVKP